MSNNNEGFSIEGLMSSLTAKFSCTLSSKSPKRRKLETPPLTPACLSFNEEEEEERKLETFAKKRCRSKFTCTLSNKTPKRRKLETPPLTPVCLSFNEEEEEEEERKLETFAKKRCRFYKYDEEEEKWSTKIGGVCKAILGKDLRKGIVYGVAWLILKSDKGEELLSHAVEPNVS